MEQSTNANKTKTFVKSLIWSWKCDMAERIRIISNFTGYNAKDIYVKIYGIMTDYFDFCSEDCRNQNSEYLKSIDMPVNGINTVAVNKDTRVKFEKALLCIESKAVLDFDKEFDKRVSDIQYRKNLEIQEIERKAQEKISLLQTNAEKVKCQLCNYESKNKELWDEMKPIRDAINNESED